MLDLKTSEQAKLNPGKLLHINTLHCIALHCIALRCVALHCIAFHCIALHCIAIHFIKLHYIALHYITLSSKVEVEIFVRIYLHKPSIKSETILELFKVQWTGGVDWVSPGTSHKFMLMKMDLYIPVKKVGKRHLTSISVSNIKMKIE